MEITWVPDRLQTVISYANGLGSLMLMSWEWDRMAGIGQRLRYLSLLAYALLISGGTAEKLADPRTAHSFGYRTLATLVVTIFLLVAVAITWRDAYRDHQKKRNREGV